MKGVPYCCPRMGGRDKGNILFASRQLRWHEKLRRRKSEGGAGIPFPLAPFPFRPARALGWEAARLCDSKEAKPAKIDSLKEKGFCACSLKEKEIFEGFVRRQAASPTRAEFLPVRAEIVAQKRFELRLVGARGFEPPTPSTPYWCAKPNCATPRNFNL